MIIRTSPQYPPIPVRDFDWQAYEPGDALGHGATEEQAIAELLAALELPADTPYTIR